MKGRVAESGGGGLFAPRSVEPFINYGERAGVVCAASREQRQRGCGIRR